MTKKSVFSKMSRKDAEFFKKVQSEISNVLNKHKCSLMPQATLTPQGINWNLTIVRNPEPPQ